MALTFSCLAAPRSRCLSRPTWMVVSALLLGCAPLDCPEGSRCETVRYDDDPDAIGPRFMPTPDAWVGGPAPSWAAADDHEDTGAPPASNVPEPEVPTPDAPEVSEPDQPGLTVADLGAFAVVPAGRFIMGCVPGRDDLIGNCAADEFPAHEVVITRAYEVMVTEVTQGMWERAFHVNPSSSSACGQHCPVESISWWESLLFANIASLAAGLPACYTLLGCTGALFDDLDCTAVQVNTASAHPADCLGYRLPTEAEWERAARGGEDHAFSGSNILGEVAWFDGNAGMSPHPVCDLTPNGFGLCDMSGNVVEWVWDVHTPSPYTLVPRVDPEFTGPGPLQCTRGGHYALDAHRNRVSRRGRHRPFNRSGAVGMRLVRSLFVAAP